MWDKVIERGAMPISSVCFLIFFGYSSLLTFLTPFAESVGLTRAASVFFIVYALSMFLTRPFTGRAFDRRGPLLVMIPAFFSFTAGMVMLAFASNDWMILGAPCSAATAWAPCNPAAWPWRSRRLRTIG